MAASGGEWGSRGGGIKRCRRRALGARVKSGTLRAAHLEGGGGCLPHTEYGCGGPSCRSACATGRAALAILCFWGPRVSSWVVSGAEAKMGLTLDTPGVVPGLV